MLEPLARERGWQSEYAVRNALMFNWEVVRDTAERRRANGETRTIWTPAIVSDEDLAAFMHEGGHVEDQAPMDGRVVVYDASDGLRLRVNIPREVAAWRFALTRLRARWNAAMHEELKASVHSYAVDWRSLIRSMDRASIRDLLADSAELASGRRRFFSPPKPYTR